MPGYRGYRIGRYARYKGSLKDMADEIEDGIIANIDYMRKFKVAFALMQEIFEDKESLYTEPKKQALIRRIFKGMVLEDQVEYCEEFDCENDEVYGFYFCTQCNSTGVRPRDNTFEPVDHERWLWATGFYDDVAGVGELH